MKKHTIAIMLACIFASSGASAGFINEAQSNPLSGAQGQIILVGKPIQPQTANGFGRGVPLSEAVGQIVPREFSVRTAGIEQWAFHPVTWRGGRDWVSVLSEVLALVPQIQAEIDQDNHVVTLRRYDAPQQAVKGAAASAGGQWDIRMEDGDIQVSLRRWATKAGWSLVWEIDGVVYPVIANASLNGTFEEAVEAVIKSLARIDVPPKAKFHTGNNVLRIIPKGKD